MNLSRVLADHQAAEKLSIRRLAKQVGIEHTKLFRFIKGRDCDARTLTTILLYLLEEK